MALDEVRILNSEINTYYQFFVRRDRFESFLNQCSTALVGWPPASDWGGHCVWGDSISGAAVVGLNALFNHIPLKFPVADIVRFLQDEASKKAGVLFDFPQIEHQLELFGQYYPGIDCEGNDV